MRRLQPSSQGRPVKSATLRRTHRAGLSGTLYIQTSDVARAKKIAEQLEAGRVTINGAASEPQAPFGGVKQSGIGREFGVFGLEAFLEPRTILA